MSHKRKLKLNDYSSLEKGILIGVTVSILFMISWPLILLMTAAYFIYKFHSPED